MGTNPMNLPESHFDNLINEIKRGRLIPVVGGDINLCGRPQDKDGLYVSWQDHKDKAKGIYYPPTTSELAIHLLGKAIEASNNGGPPLPSIFSELIDNKGDRNVDDFLPVGLVNICQYLNVWQSEWQGGWLQDEMQKVLSLDFEPTPIHEFLAQLASVEPDPAQRAEESYPYPIIVTVCFDDVLENLLKTRKQLYHQISFVLDEDEGGKFEYCAPGQNNPVEIENTVDTATKEALKKYPVIIKLNKFFKAGQESYALTEDHYIDYLTYKNVKASFPDMLFNRLTNTNKLSNPHLLFMGYSPRYWNLRVILRRIWSVVLSVKSKQWTFVQEERKDLVDQDYWNLYASEQYIVPKAEMMLVAMEVYAKKLTVKLGQSFLAGSSLQKPPGSSAMTSKPSAVSKQQSSLADSQRNLVFFSYSHEDEEWLGKIEKGLIPVLKKLKLEPWTDKKIKAGGKWSDEIKAALAVARAAILLVSPDFLVSDFIMNNELPSLLKSAEEKGCKILWIKVRDCSWEDSELKDYQGLYQKTPLAYLNENEFDTTMVEIGKDFANALIDTI